ncbi:MAG: hypothetical protein M1818_004429 [Claussenomyces sp. TS43310]|nr:MAG: hypothetical protein M1818_004429 [Claussenomyces sp. TS43310]
MKKRKRDMSQYGESELHMKLGSPAYLSPRAPSDMGTTSEHDTTAFSTQSRPHLKPRLARHDPKRQRIMIEAQRPNDAGRTHPDWAQRGPEDGKYGGQVTDTMTMATTGESHGPTLRSPGLRAAQSAATLLRACHICHRKPTVRRDLDSYADCEGCGERTCYICVRECLGPYWGSAATGDAVAASGGGRKGNWKGDDEVVVQEDGVEAWQLGGMDEDAAEHKRAGYGYGDTNGDVRLGTENPQRKGAHEQTWLQHRGMVCSRCCVERGADGEVRCLGCLRAEEAR